MPDWAVIVILVLILAGALAWEGRPGSRRPRRRNDSGDHPASDSSDSGTHSHRHGDGQSQDSASDGGDSGGGGDGGGGGD